MSRAVVIGEALVDLVIDETGDGLVAYPRFGGSPFNVAVGTARCGVPVSYAGPRCADFFGTRLSRFAEADGIDLSASTPSAGDTCLAVAIREGDSVRFDSFTRPDVLTRIGALPTGLVAGAGVVHAGSIALLEDPARQSVLDAFDVPGPCRTLDLNPRPAILDDPAAYRDRLAAFLPLADVVKLSEDDARFLYDAEPVAAVRDLHDGGIRTVILTRGPDGAHLIHGGAELAVPAPAIDFVDATGAGDAFMARVVAELARLDGKPPADLDGWRPIVTAAVRAAGQACERRGGAEAMPRA